MSIKVLQAGFLATIQDLGRYGLQKYGVIVGGAMDIFAVRMANILVGNKENEGTIEITMFGTKLLFNEAHLIAITGGCLQPTIDDKPVLMWRPILVKKGQVLQFNGIKSGARAYIAFAGGLNVPKVMNSKSTYIPAKLGGFKGRQLQKGDILTCGEISNQAKYFVSQLEAMKIPFSWSVNHASFYTCRKPQSIRIIQGAEFEKFNDKSQQAFVETLYTLTVHADRMGYQLKGAKLQLKEKFELLSEGVTYGTIQVPSNGQPIILMADRQTTGGYPKIGQVISVDLPRLAQLQPNQQIKFEVVSIDEAENLLMQQEKDIYELKMGIYFKAHLTGRKKY